MTLTAALTAPKLDGVCSEWFPADEEFFYRGIWQCIACVRESHARQRAKAAAA